MTIGKTRPSSRLGRAALAYADQLAWSVFPLAPRSKKPAILGGRGCLDATRDLAVIERWWHGNPAYNIGIATGSTSGFFAVDVDPRAGGDVSLGRLQAERGPFPDTVEQLTGGDGHHLLFQRDAGLDGIRWAPLAPGIDVKGNRGYIVGAPSVHPDTGKSYAWDSAHHPLKVAVASPPHWLTAILAGRTVNPSAPTRASSDLLQIHHGSRNATLASIAGSLRRRGICHATIAAALRAINSTTCQPPLPDREVVAIARSISRYTPSPHVPDCADFEAIVARGLHS